MTVKDAGLAVDFEVHQSTGSKNSALSSLVIDLMREVRQELQMQDNSTTNSAKNDLSIVDFEYRSIEYRNLVFYYPDHITMVNRRTRSFTQRRAEDLGAAF